MMAKKGLNDVSRGDGSCVATEEILRRDGTRNASRRKKAASRGRKKGFLERKTMSFGAENYELVLLTKEW